MKNNFFKDCHDLDSARLHYHNLALIHHPDRGGDTATMQQINAQYAEVMAHIQLHAERERQAKAHSEDRHTYADYNDLDEIFMVLKSKIKFCLDLSPSIAVELTGSWIWLHGDTKPVKEDLKAQGFRWSGDKQLWYYAGAKTFNRRAHSMDYIRKHYGSHWYSTEEERTAAIAG